MGVQADTRSTSARRSCALAGVGLLAGALAGCSSGPAPPASQGPPATQADQLVKAGLKAQAHGQTAMALTDYEAATVKDPTNTYAYYDSGVIYQQRGDGTDAENAYHRALLANPNYKPALFNLAVLVTPTDPAQAETLYRQLLQINANDPNVNFNLGLLLIAQNQSVEGHVDLAKAIQLNPALRSRVPPGITP